MRLRVALLAGLGLLAAQPSWAFFSDDEARKQVAELRKAVETMAQQVDRATKNQIDFANQIEALRAEMAQLRGQVEVLTNAVETSNKRQQDFYVDLDNRLRKLEGGADTGPVAAPSSASSPAAASAKPVDPQAEMREYEAALGLFRESKFKEAQTAFEALIANHPKGTLLPNAHYWLGSSLYQQKGYLQSAATFGKVASNWPHDPKAPDALLKQADALVAAKDVNGAVKVLETLVEKYPTNPAVETARARIKTLAPKKK
jgi:tol-pal system protein YbgF